MRASELPAISLQARPIQLTDRHRLWGRTLGAAEPFGVVDLDRRLPAREPSGPLLGVWRLGPGGG